MYFVRTASERDLKQVRALLVETWHVTYDSIFGAAKVDELLAAWHSPAALQERLKRKNGEFLVADSGKELGGMAFAVMSGEMAKTVILHQLYIRPACQRQGIGREFLTEIEGCFPDAEIMRLEVDPGNPEAMAFYRAQGFVEVGRTENCGPGQCGLPALIFEKSLP